MQTYRPYESSSRLISSFAAFLLPFLTAISEHTGIHCDSLLQYLYYRSGVSYGLWLHFACRESFEFFARAFALLVVYRTDDAARGRQQVRDEAVPMLAGFAVRFVETLACAVGMNFAFAMFCNLFWHTGNERFMQNYLWGFLNDVFGTCAAGGYMEAWGYQCIA